MYKASSQQPGGGQAGPTPPGPEPGGDGKGGKDNVVDAEFVDVDDKK